MTIHRDPDEPVAELLPTKSIPSETRKRLDDYVYLNVRPALQAEYEQDGWVVHKVLKRSVKMRKPKPHDSAFEDRVWACFARLNFTDLNKGRSFALAYGKGENERQQIDVFAADEEVALVIECKSTAEIKRAQLKKEVEAFSGITEGLRKSVRERYPQHKVKFILATNNFALSTASVERIKDAGLVHMDEEAIDYYLELSAHLGKAARFQLLGALFDGQKIPEMSTSVPAIRSKMGSRTYYMFAIEPSRLLKMAYVLHRNKANSALMPTYQRLIKKGRLKQVSTFVDDGGFFPNSLIININAGSRGLRFNQMGKSTDGHTKVGILELPAKYRSAYVIDGQHRLYGFADSVRAESELIPVVAFVDLPQTEQVRIFMEINENQKSVPKNLQHTLNADLLWSSDDLREQEKAIRLRLAQRLGEDKASPLFGRVIVGEEKKTSIRCITIEAISNGLGRGSYLGSFTSGTVKEVGTFYQPDPEATFEALLPFLFEAFDYFREQLEAQWDLGSSEGGFVFMNNGVESLIRVLSDVVDHLVAGGTDPRSTDARDLLQQCQYYLDPLVEYLGTRTLEEGAELRRLYGSGGAAKYWRRLQQVVRDARPQFEPDGLAEWIAQQEKTHNMTAWELITDIEAFLNSDIKRRLQDDFGAVWMKDGVPRKVLIPAAKLAGEKNIDLPEDQQVSAWDCLFLIDYHAILTQEHGLWQRLFAARYTKPGDEQKKGGWQKRSSWLPELNDIRKRAAHGHSITEEELDTLVALKSWLVDNDYNLDG